MSVSPPPFSRSPSAVTPALFSSVFSLHAAAASKGELENTYWSSLALEFGGGNVDCCVPRFAAGGELTDHEPGGKREEGLCIHYCRSVTLPVTWEGYQKEYREKVRGD